MVTIAQLIEYLDKTLQPQNFSDYGPNGLQVQGGEQIAKVVTGVTANRALIEKAVALKAQAVLVHHGIFWKGVDFTLTGFDYQKIKPLIDNNINLIAYHLPLDAHPKLGNNAQLGHQLNLKHIKFFDIDKNPGLLAVGALATPKSLDEFSEQIESTLNRSPMVFGASSSLISNVAWCTGGAQRYFPYAIEKGVDAYITGEYSLPMAELAIEAGMPFIAAGHHATERGGVQALGDLIAKHFKLDVQFIDIDLIA